MNRPIKYRVWDHILSEWIKSDQLVLRPNGSITDGSILIDSKYIQFNTSLKDKNGNPIYEGDFIRGMFDFGPAGYREEIVPVIWTNEDGYQWNYWDLSTIEVIGNKHQWPCKFDHNLECMVCDCWASDCPFVKFDKNKSSFDKNKTTTV